MDYGDDYTASQLMSQSPESQNPTAADRRAQLPLGRHGKDIYDALHHQMYFRPETIAIMDTPQVQRLRDVKQLSMASYIYPSANHRRFDHSLGVSHLARKTGDHILYQQKQELDLHKDDITCLEIAGLCHDLGHGPFSHSFEVFLHHPRIDNKAWHHEEMSVKMLEAALTSSGARDAFYTDSNTRKIKDMIMASKDKCQSSSWLYDVVANGRNGLDVDKFDYIQRDAFFTGVKIMSDFGRVLQYSKVIEDEVCYRYDMYESCMEILQDRARLYRKVYHHRKAMAIELMVTDCLLEADQELGLSASAENADDFMRLDDTILKEIERWGRGPKRRQVAVGSLLEAVGSEDDHTGMRKAQGLVDRLHSRRLYRYCNEFLVPHGAASQPNWLPPSPEDIVAACSVGTGTPLRPEDVIVQQVAISLTAGADNPMKRVHFFDHADCTTKQRRPQHSHMELKAYEDRHVRIYSRSTDPQVREALAAGTKTWVERKWSGHTCATPLRPRAPAGTAADIPAAHPRLVQNGTAKKRLRYTSNH